MALAAPAAAAVALGAKVLGKEVAKALMKKVGKKKYVEITRMLYKTRLNPKQTPQKAYSGVQRIEEKVGAKDGGHYISGRTLAKGRRDKLSDIKKKLGDRGAMIDDSPVKQVRVKSNVANINERELTKLIDSI